MRLPSVLFVSTMGGSQGGGSEELWSRTALDLASRGFPVAAIVVGWDPRNERLLVLAKAGVDVTRRTMPYPLWRRALSKIGPRGKPVMGRDLEKQIARMEPSLVVLSDGAGFPGAELLEACVAMGVPFVTIGQANSEYLWMTDDVATRFRASLPAAQRCFFVSQANLGLAEKQVGCKLPNAEVVWNPFNVDFDICLEFPTYTEQKGLLLACVGRLHPPSKGQDILLEALASPVWTERNWRLRLYGAGNMADSLKRMTRNLGLSDRVSFCGYVAVKEIWAENQALVMPSRYEGLPLAMVEAMLCARTVVATDVAGHSEVIDDGVTGFLATAPTVPALLEALERLWVKRARVEEIGQVAAKRIRQLVPPDPIAIFSGKLRQLMNPA